MFGGGDWTRQSIEEWTDCPTSCCCWPGEGRACPRDGSYITLTVADDGKLSQIKVIQACEVNAAGEMAQYICAKIRQMEYWGLDFCNEI